MPSRARSRSKTTDATLTGNAIEASRRSITRSPTLSPTNPTLSDSDQDSTGQSKTHSTMATTVTTQRSHKATIEPKEEGLVDEDGAMDVDDNRSSSLSDVDDAHEDPLMTSPDLSTSKLDGELEEDSEAETERLEHITPKARRGTLSDGMFSTEKTSSALARELQVDSDIEEEPSPLSRSRDVEVEEGLDPLDSLASIATSIAEQPQLKRKRSSSEGSELSDIMEMDEPVRKRSHSQREVDEDEDDLEEEADEALDDAIEDGAIEEEADAELEKNIAGLDDEEIVSEAQPIPRSAKARKGKRKGKKTAEIDVERENLTDDLVNVADVEADDAAEGEVEAEEEDTAAADEELTKKKAALDGIAGLERHFIAWRKSYLSAEAAEIEKEMKLLEDPIYQCRHPDFLARRTAIDGRRDEKIKYEDTLTKYKREQEGIKLVAGRQQIGSQYFQSVRQLRDTMLEQCNKHFHALHRDRRRWGADDRSHLRMFVPDRRQQVKDQTKYNKEVSILAGVAKYHGMPAAPNLRQTSKDSAEDDFQKMGLTIQPVQQRVVSRQPALAAPSNAPEDRTEAAAQFYEQTPWANPLHPAHQENPAMSNYYNPVGRAAPTSYATPIAQERTANGQIGSASTIEAMSNQNSSAMGPHSRNVPDHPQQHYMEDTPLLRRVASGTQFIPSTSGPRRETLPPDASQTPVPNSTKAYALHSDNPISQPYPASALHNSDASYDREADRPPSLLGQRPFAVGVNSGRLGV